MSPLALNGVRTTPHSYTTGHTLSHAVNCTVDLTPRCADSVSNFSREDALAMGVSEHAEFWST